MYVVKSKFKDKTTNHVYDEGRIFPYDGVEVPSDRIKELSSEENKLKRVLIEEKTIEDLSEEQICEYARIINLDVKSLIINSLSDKVEDTNNQDNTPDKDNSDTVEDTESQDNTESGNDNSNSEKKNKKGK